MDTAMVAATNVKSLADISRIEPFNGTHYNRWKEKVMSTLDVTGYQINEAMVIRLMSTL